MELFLNIAASATITVFAIRNVWLRKMKLHAFMILYAMLFLRLLPGAFIGQFSSFTVILGICLYGFLIDKTSRPQNICMGLLGYSISVVINNLISGIYSLLYGEFLQLNSYFWTIIVPFLFVITYICSYILGKLIRTKVLSMEGVLHIRPIWYLADATLLLCSFVFAFNNTAGERAGYPVDVVYFNCLLFIAYFVIAIFLLVSTFKAYREKVQGEMKQQSFQELQEYTSNLETMYGKLRSFKHDYINILTSLSGYIEQGDMGALKIFFEAKILPTRTQIMQSNNKLSQLSNICILELKSLMSAKITYAYELGIDVTIDIPDTVTHLNMDTIDLARVLGIFFDNAIEAALETEQPKVGLCMIHNPKTVAIIIRNSFCDIDLPLHKLKQRGFTTKVGHQGIGLSSAQEIISTYKNVLLETSKHSSFFTQYMEIPVEKEV